MRHPVSAPQLTLPITAAAIPEVTGIAHQQDQEEEEEDQEEARNGHQCSEWAPMSRTGSTLA